MRTQNLPVNRAAPQCKRRVFWITDMIKEQGHQPHKSNVMYSVFTELGGGEILFIASIDEHG